VDDLAVQESIGESVVTATSPSSLWRKFSEPARTRPKKMKSADKDTSTFGKPTLEVETVCIRVACPTRVVPPP